MNHVLTRLALLVSAFALSSQAQIPASLSGTIVDVRGAAIAGAKISLAIDGQSPNLETASNPDGQFSFPSLHAAGFYMVVTAPGFAPASLSGALKPAQALTLLPTTLEVARLTTNVDVTLTQNEIAQEQLKQEEKQRLLGILPNYYVTYEPNPAPLTAKQKFGLAWKTTYDPVSLGITAIIAGISQSRNTYAGYGQGTEGYAKRYGATYADFFSGLMVGGAILPTLLKQDPRYFYKGTGSKTARLIYALERSFICQGDNGRAEFNYSSIIGGMASGGISNLYYPDKNRSSGELIVKNMALGIASNAISNVIQEFFFRKITRKVPPIVPAGQ